MEWLKNNKEKITAVELSTVNERMAMGNKLYVAAWIFEIVAATIGLYVAWTTGNNISALEGHISPEQQAQIILGSLPFVMVALAEILKVPIVYLIYINRNVFTKIFFSVILFGLTLITFETLAAAFENQFTNIIQKVQKPQEEINYQSENILILKGRIKSTEEQTLESLNATYNSNIVSLNDTYQKTIKNLNSQKSTIEETSAAASIDRIAKIQKQIDNLRQNRDLKIQKAKKDYEEGRNFRTNKLKIALVNRDKEAKLIDDEIAKANENIKEHDKKAKGSFLSWCKDDKQCKKNFSRIDELTKKKQDILDASFVGLADENSFFETYQQEVKNIENKYQDKTDPLKEKISSIEDIILSQKENNLQIKNLNQDLEGARVKHKENIEKADKDHKAAIELLNTNKEKVKTWRDQIEIAEKKIETLVEDVRKHEAFTQIWRFTKYRMGVESASKVSLDDVTTTAFWWYGSLAALVSIMGVVLAFGALILKHPKEKYKDLQKEKRHRLKNTIRRMFISLRKRIREPKIVTKTRIKEVPKEVIKEVPVQKVVLTEVPIEVTKVEEVYVPRYSDDEDLLKLGTAGYIKKIIGNFGKGKNKRTKKKNKDN